MLWGHSIQYFCGDQFDFWGSIVFKTIYSFHMPLFMLISGYLFFFSAQKRRTAELIEYKAKSLLYPILMCSLLTLLLTEVPYSVFRDYKSVLGGTQLTSLWFLWSVLSCSIAVAVAVKPFKNIVIQIVLLIVGLGIVALLPCWKHNINMYPFFVLGYLYARNEKFLKRFFNAFAIISTVGFIIYSSGLLENRIKLELFNIDLLAHAASLFGSVSVIWVFSIIYRIVNNRKAFKGMELLGQYSLAVYALQSSLLSFWLPKLASVFYKLFPGVVWNDYMWLYDLIVTPLIAVAYSALLLGVIKLMKKTRIYRLVFGRE